MGKIQFIHSYQYIISIENLLEAWTEFIDGKRSRKDVQKFSRNLMSNIISLHRDLAMKNYRHSAYELFKISDPKPREIHKANVRDRLLHRALYRTLYPFFDKTFISDSYSCRLDKGTHRAMNRFREFAYIASQNNTKTTWVLKCDIKKFFHSIDHDILIKILNKYIKNEDIRWLIFQVINSFFSTENDVGLPLGNITSQLFANVYMNEFDQFVKHRLKAKYYIRYADDFVILSRDKQHLDELLLKIREFLEKELKLNLHEKKICIKNYASGVDFLGWVHFPGYRRIRTTTGRRVIRRLKEHSKKELVASYRGLLSHGNAYRLKRKLGFAEF
jgi:retron-type reverse transcriptase